MGLVTHVYNEETIQNLKGHIAIGHNRYSTSEGSHIKTRPADCNQRPRRSGPQRQPAFRNRSLKNFWKTKIFPPTIAAIPTLMAKALDYYLEHGLSIKDAVIKCYPLFTGAFCLTILTKDTLGGRARHLLASGLCLWVKLTVTATCWHPKPAPSTP